HLQQSQSEDHAKMTKETQRRKALWDALEELINHRNELNTRQTKLQNALELIETVLAQQSMPFSPEMAVMTINPDVPLESVEDYVLSAAHRLLSERVKENTQQKQLMEAIAAREQ